MLRLASPLLMYINARRILELEFHVRRACCGSGSTQLGNQVTVPFRQLLVFLFEPVSVFLHAGSACGVSRGT
jgi:hypothetical protein